MLHVNKLLSKTLEPCLRRFGTQRYTQGYKTTRLVLRRTSRIFVNVLKVNALVIFIPVKTFCYLAGAYGVFCIGYSKVYPENWHLSDHNILLSGIVRVFRTVFNAALIFAMYKYSFWGMEDPNHSDDPKQNGFGPPNSEVSVTDLTPEQKKYKEAQHEYWSFASNRIANVMLTNGGIYVKVGQAMATFSAMLPPEFTTALKPLLSNIFERQCGEIDHMFVKDLGEKPEKLFAEFQKDPFAGASIAQVFLGKTYEGQKVAVKVQYFDIAKRFKTDKGTVLFLLRVLDWFSPGIPLLRVMPHVFDNLEKELDFVNEGGNSELCRNDLSNLNFVKIPQVHWGLTSKRILTMEFAEGINLIDTEKVITAGFTAKDILEKVIRIFSEQIFRTGNIHSDPHPGNLMVTKNAKTGKTEIVVIDHGLYEQLPSNYCNAFSLFWHSVIIDDYDEVQKSGERLGIAYPDMMATLLFFKPYGEMKKLGFGGMHGERRKKLEDMNEEEKEQMEAIRQMGHDTVDSFPQELALVIRNIRLIQGINLSFGVPVNRVRLMAEVAVKYSKKNDDVISYLFSRMKFEWHFFVLDLRNRLLSWALWAYSFFAKRVDGEVDISKFALFLKA